MLAPVDPKARLSCQVELSSMIDESRAGEVAKDAFEAEEVVLGRVRELNDGWFFPCE